MRHFFHSSATQDQLTPYPTSGADLLPIIFRLCKVIGSQREIDRPLDVDSYYNRRRTRLREQVLEVHPSSNRTTNTRDQIARLLSDSLSVPEDDQCAIIEKVFKVLEDPVPELPIVVYVAEVTLHILDGNDDIIERVTRESLDTYTPNLIPAAKSSIQGLETLRLDSFEIKSINEQTQSCVICREGLDYSDDDVAAQEEDRDHKRRQIWITRMPCLHYYHQDCIVHWLEINHWCPICRYPMPTVDESGGHQNPNLNPNKRTRLH